MSATPMFQTIEYKGHHIQITTGATRTRYQVRLGLPSGSFALLSVETLAGAKRRITKHVRDLASAVQP